jgi:hypothetical protein
MEELYKAKRDTILYSLGFCIGIATLLIDTIPVIAIGAIIFCPYYAVKSFRRYRRLMKFQFERSQARDLI